MGGGAPVAELVIEILEGKELSTKSFSGRCNSYCTVTFENQTYRTSIVKNSLNPHWNESFSFDIFHNSPDKTIFIHVFEKSALFREHPIGRVTIPLSYFQENLTVSGWFELTNEKRKHPGFIHFSAMLHSNEEDEEIFKLFVKNLDLDNNWVVIDPSLDAYKIEDSISENQNEQKNEVEVSVDQREPVEVKKELPEDPIEVVSVVTDPEVQLFLQNEQKEQERLLQEFLKEQYKCQQCNQGQEPSFLLELECNHSFCVECVREHAVRKLQNPTITEIVCCNSNCKAMIGQWALKKALLPSDFESFLSRALQQVIDNCEDMFACPNPSCGVVVERVHSDHMENASEPEGMSPEAHRHKEEFRFRCRECTTEFCSSCMRIPYHSGFTCEAYEEYLQSRRCRFCKETIAREAIALRLSTEGALADVCEDDECQAKKKNACSKIHECLHPCGGVRNEEICLPCLHEDCVKDGATNEEDWCSICYVEDLGSAPSIQLECSHILHYHCVLAKLQQKWPSPRITFGFWNCPECKQEMKHPALEDALAPLKELYEEISKKALQRLSFEGMDKHDDIVKEGGRFYKDPLAFAMNHFAYYPCYVCKKPYFGGQVRCDAGNNDQPFKAEDLVCGGCSGAGAQECPAHGKEFMEHKCQFCCNVASWFCWGKTHFCDPCHTRQQKGDYVSKYSKDKLPKCPGKKNCPLKVDHPPNGEPFCLGCAFCRNQDF